MFFVSSPIFNQLGWLVEIAWYLGQTPSPQLRVTVQTELPLQVQWLRCCCAFFRAEKPRRVNVTPDSWRMILPVDVHVFVVSNYGDRKSEPLDLELWGPLPKMAILWLIHEGYWVLTNSDNPPSKVTPLQKQWFLIRLFPGGRVVLWDEAETRQRFIVRSMGFVGMLNSFEPRKIFLLLSIESWLFNKFNRDPCNGLS